MTQTFRPVGHLIHHGDEPPAGTAGSGYNYILAGNGLFIRSQNDLLAATALYIPADVRGLPKLDPTLHMTHGPIPVDNLHRILRAMRLAAPAELLAAITHTQEHGYSLVYPPQHTGPTHVRYDPVPDTVLEIHSHANGTAHFSHTDDEDEQGLAIYGVAGTISTRPTVTLRLGVYGHFQTVAVKEVFTELP